LDARVDEMIKVFDVLRPYSTAHIEFQQGVLDEIRTLQDIASSSLIAPSSVVQAERRTSDVTIEAPDFTQGIYQSIGTHLTKPLL
jgi:hypothetical protein